MKTALENQREAQEKATARRDAYKKKMRWLALIVGIVAGFIAYLIGPYIL